VNSEQPTQAVCSFALHSKILHHRHNISFFVHTGVKMTIVAASDNRNSAWANDKSSFAHRMMTKMGWKEGEGLGKNKQGNVHSLRAVKMAEEALGIGASIDVHGSGGFDKTRDNFTNVLASLKSQHCADDVTDEKVKTKKKKKKKKDKEKDKDKDVKKKKKKRSKGITLAQNRVSAGHSKKMRHAKDLTNKSREDLIAIFGTTNVDEMITKNSKKQKSGKKNKTM